MRSTMGRRAYSSDVTDQQWDLLGPLIPLPSLEGRLATVERREIVNAILYVLRSGCPWRLLPHEFPAWGDRLLLLPSLATRRRLGADPEDPAHAGAPER